ncbi:hypothetical protein D3C73_1371220 [compost metagenome]
MSNVVFGCWRENGRIQLRVFAKPFRQCNTVDLTAILILSPTAPGDISTYDAFDIDTLRFAGNHNAVFEQIRVSYNVTQSIHICMNDVIVHHIAR